MSWSVSRVGKSDKLGSVIKSDLANSKCSEPEESIKAAVGERLIAKALDGNIPATAVKVTAFGSQSVSGSTGGPNSVSNSLKIEIEQLYGFVD